MFRRLGASIRKWMYGRYGSDQLNMLLLVLAVILSLTNTILTYALRTSTVYRGIIAPILSLLMYGLLILAMVRMFSRNLSRRERENRRRSEAAVDAAARPQQAAAIFAARRAGRASGTSENKRGAHRGRERHASACPKCGEN